MKLGEIKKVKHCFSEEEVNKALKQGYKIFKSVQTRYKTPEFEEVRILYCLGK